MMLTVEASYTPFKRNDGTADASKRYSYSGLEPFPFQEAPVFGMKCSNGDCGARRF